MSCSGDSNGNGGIRVRRDTLVTVEDYPQALGDGSASPVTTTIRSREPSASRPQRSRPKSSPSFSGSPGLVREMLRSDAPSRRRPKTIEGDITEDLIHFFRETPPPPGNPMSTPGSFDDKSERNSRRFPFWPFRRKQKKSDNKSEGAQGLIKLPDSAVAGTTTDGHRHIAISIPIEYDHLEPATRTSAAPRTESPTQVVVGDQAGEEEPETPEDRDGGGTNYVTSTEDDTPCLPRRSSKRRAQQETAESSQPRSGNASVGAHNMILNPCRELTAVQKGSTCNPVSVTNPLPSPRRPLRRQPVIRPISADSDRALDSSDPRPTVSDLRKRSSNPESSGTSSSEVIFSDAETVAIPSPQSTSEVSTSSDRSSSYYTPELGQSPRVKSSPDTEGEGGSENSSVVFHFSAPYNPSTSRTSSIPEFALAHPTVFWHDLHQPHALSAITSSGSVTSSARQDPASFSIAPIVTLADYQPSPPSPLSSHTSPSAGHHPPETSTTASAAHGFLTPTSTPTTTSTTSTNPYPAPPVPHYHHHLFPAGSAPPLPPRSPRRRHNTAHNNPHHRKSPLLNRHHHHHHGQESAAASLLTMTHAREREMHALLDRLERLAHANERWLSALQPVFERVLASRRGVSHLMMGGGSSSRPSAGSLPLDHLGGGGNLGGRRRGSFSSSSCSSNGVLGLGEGGGGRRVAAQAPSPSIRLRRPDDGGGSDAVPSDVSRTAHHPRLHTLNGYGLGSGEVNDGLHDHGGVNINDESWLRSDSGSANCSACMSGTVVLDGEGWGRWRSGDSLRGAAGGWRTTFAGRQAEAFARDQLRRQLRDEYLDDLDDEVAPGPIEDPSGWDTLETLMRDLVLGSQHGDESIEGSTLFG